MVEVIFYIVAIFAIFLLVRENQNQKKRIEKLKESVANGTRDYKYLENRHFEIEKTNAKLAHEVKILSTFKVENERLKTLLNKIKSSYSNNICDSKDQLDGLLRDEYELIKEEEELIKEEESLLAEDNELLKEEESLLREQNDNYRQQIDELRESNKHIHKYVETINKLNHKVQELIDKNAKLQEELKEK